MAKNTVCKGCVHNNNGWCGIRKTNKGLKELIECEYRKTDSLLKLEDYLKQKQFELQMDNTSYNRGIVKGLEIALAITKE